MKIDGYIMTNFVFYEEGDYWLGECLELGTATFGHTLKEAKERLEEAVLLHINTLEDVGERARFFTEHNIKFYSYKPRIRSFHVSTSPRDNIFVNPHIQPIPTLTGV